MLEQARHSAPYPRLLVAAAVAVFACLAGLIAVSPRVLLYDERYYMEAAYFLVDRFDFGVLMQTRLDVAAGPLYAYLHYGLSPLTGLSPPAIRIVNLACLGLVIGVVGAVLRRLGYANAWARAGLILAVPMIIPASGLALTELPAMACVAGAVLAVTVALGANSTPRIWGLFAFAGLCAGIAILGRQTYLPALAGFVAVAAFDRRMAGPAALAIATALATIAPMVLAWGGLTPPWQTSLGGGISPVHGVLAFIYLAAAIVLIAPQFVAAAFATRPRQAAALAIAGASAAICLVLGFRFPVATRVIDRLPDGIEPLAAVSLNAAMLTIGALTGLAALFNVWDRRSDRTVLLCGALTVLMTGTAAGITMQFSSRYVLGAFPFALILLQPWVRLNAATAARVVLGAALGFASLGAYYWNVPPPNPADKPFAPPELLAKMPLGQPR